MLLIKYLLMGIGIAMFGSAAAILGYDIYVTTMMRRTLAQLQPGQPEPEEHEVRWRTTAALVLLAWAPILVSISLVVVPEGMGGVASAKFRARCRERFTRGSTLSALSWTRWCCSIRATSCSPPAQLRITAQRRREPRSVLN